MATKPEPIFKRSLSGRVGYCSEFRTRSRKSLPGRAARHEARRTHFGRAAESCAVTQSTLSGGIKELEARLGVTLFERGHRHVMLTPLGKEIAVRAQRLLVDAEELVGLARNAQEPLSGPLRFGVIPTIGPYLLPSLLSHLGAA